MKLFDILISALILLFSLTAASPARGSAVAVDAESPVSSVNICEPCEIHSSGCYTKCDGHPPHGYTNVEVNGGAEQSKMLGVTPSSFNFATVMKVRDVQATADDNEINVAIPPDLCAPCEKVFSDCFTTCDGHPPSGYKNCIDWCSDHVCQGWPFCRGSCGWTRCTKHAKKVVGEKLA